MLLEVVFCMRLMKTLQNLLKPHCRNGEKYLVSRLVFPKQFALVMGQ